MIDTKETLLQCFTIFFDSNSSTHEETLFNYDNQQLSNKLH